MTEITIAPSGTECFTVATFSRTGGVTLGPQIVNAGRWVISQSFHVCVTKKPCWLHRIMTKTLLGWEWQDE